MYELKDRDCQSGSKNKIQIYAVFLKKNFKHKNIYRLKVDGEKYSMTIQILKSRSSHMNFRESRLQHRKITRDSQGHYVMLKGQY